MPSDYVRKLRQHLGHDLIWLPGVTAVTRNAEGKFLLLHNEDNDCWVFPGGAVEFGETLEAATLRELREKTGVDATFGESIDVRVGDDHVVPYRNGDRVAYMTAYYFCYDTGATPPICGDEAKAVGYFTLDEMEKLKLMPWMRALLPAVRKKLTG